VPTNRSPEALIGNWNIPYLIGKDGVANAFKSSFRHTTESTASEDGTGPWLPKNLDAGSR
jgi:hypothetical protein